MQLNILFRSILIGFAIAAPVGPIGVLCIRRTLADGRMAGLATGLGAATADTMYGAVAGFGLTLISGFLVAQANWVGLVGGLFLCYLGGRTFFKRPGDELAHAGGATLLGAYVSALFLTLTNPMTILMFTGVFVGLGFGEVAGEAGAVLSVVAGVFFGSAFWWLLLSGVTSIFRTKMTPRVLEWVNRGAAVVIFGFGLVAIFSGG